MVRRRRKAPRRLRVYKETSRPTNRVIPFHRRLCRPPCLAPTGSARSTLLIPRLFPSAWQISLCRAGFIERHSAPCRAHMVATRAILVNEVRNHRGSLSLSFSLAPFAEPTSRRGIRWNRNERWKWSGGIAFFVDEDELNGWMKLWNWIERNCSIRLLYRFISKYFYFMSNGNVMNEFSIKLWIDLIVF